MEVRLYYTDEEIVRVLSDIGYTVTWKEVWDNDFTLKTQYEKNNSILIAFKGEEPEPDEFERMRSRHGIERVFEREFNKRLLDKLF